MDFIIEKKKTQKDVDRFQVHKYVVDLTKVEMRSCKHQPL
jgi:hypothetical protein